MTTGEGATAVYHRIVAGKVRGIFQQINAGNYEPMLDSLAPTFSHRFYGDHALSGERTTVAAMRLWWERVFGFIPAGRFHPQQILVKGWPWSTVIATHVTITAQLPDGSGYRNVFAQFIRMRWARITEIHTIEDTQTLVRALDSLAASGNAEAHAVPITDTDAG